MNKAISIFRICILFALGFIAMLLISSEENDENTSIWLAHFLVDKALGTIALLSTIWLYRHWSKTDSWIKAFDGNGCETAGKPDSDR